jgi:hypothetical protein
MGRRPFSSVGAPLRRLCSSATHNWRVFSRRSRARSRGCVATCGCSDASTRCSVRRRDVSTPCAIRRPVRQQKQSRTPRAISASRFNDAARRIGRASAQQVSAVCRCKIINQLHYKTVGAITLNEAYSSQTCPVCGSGATSPRDAIGAVNILSLGQHGRMPPGRILPQQVNYPRPWPRQPRSGSGGHPAYRSA